MTVSLIGFFHNQNNINIGAEKTMIDTHMHITHHLFKNTFPYLVAEDGKCKIKENGNIELLIDKMKKEGIDFVIEPAISIESNEQILEFSAKYPSFIYTAIGVHPTRTFKYISYNNGIKSAEKLSFSKMKDLKKLTENPSVVAIGETGLDFHHKRCEQHRIRQVIWFVYQLYIAKKNKLPLVLHIRKADKSALLILTLFRKWLNGGICHCFSGNYKTAEKYAKLGFKIGIGASLLNDNNHLKDTIVKAPLEWFVLETDSPYVKPHCEEYSNKKMIKARNTSLILPLVVSEISKLKGITEKFVIETTTNNVYDVFKRIR